ncbi:hypothetical protein, partial [Type-E symbiont of Plautia stali]|uniref:hypothetical protein n=1 Tax=Type-E symbiont of Plautia stali TaxID=1560357 RepID=UPI000A90A4DC
MSAAAQSAPVTEHVLTIRRLPAGIQPDAPVRLLVSAREDPPFAGPRTGRTLRLTWHLPAATRVELQGLNPSDPLSPLEEARQRRLRAGIGAEARGDDPPLTVAGLRLHRRWDSSLTAESPEAALKELLSLAPATNYELANYER